MFREYILLLFTYLKRVAKPLGLATGISLAVLGVSLLSIELPIFIACTSLVYFLAFPLLQTLLRKFFPRIRYPIQRGITAVLTTILALTALSFVLPHLFLFFNALPLVASVSFFCITTFTLVFENALQIRSLQLGNAYSLIQLILHPRTGIERLRQTLTRPSTAEQLAAQARAEENGRGNGRKPDSLRLPKSEYEQLVKRQTAAVDKIPREAIIDDVTLYQKHLEQIIADGSIRKKREDANKKQKKPTSAKELEAEIQQLISMEAIDNTSEEANSLEENYIATLTSQAQIDCYKAYRALTRKLSPPYAECEVTLASVYDNKPETFIIAEKRFLSTGHKCVPGKVHLWEYKKTYLSFFNKSVPKNPGNNDPLYAPRDENGEAAAYTFHTYTTVKGHGLSFQLCETIEALLATGLKPSANTQAKSTPAATSAPIPPYRNTQPSSAPVSAHNMFSVDEDSDQGIYEPSLHRSISTVGNRTNPYCG